MNPALIVSLIGAFVAVVMMLLTIYKMYCSIQDTHTALNSRLDALIELTRQIAFRAGVDFEKARQLKEDKQP